MDYILTVMICNSLTINGQFYGLKYGLNGSKTLINNFQMKRLFNSIFNFLKKEWFLLIAIATIGVILLIFNCFVN